MYKVEVMKSEGVSEEDFKNALNCSKSCIESIMDNETLKFEVIGNSIYIRKNFKDDVVTISLQELKNQIKGCFCNASGEIYPEFKKVIPPSFI